MMEDNNETKIIQGKPAKEVQIALIKLWELIYNLTERYKNSLKSKVEIEAQLNELRETTSYSTSLIDEWTQKISDLDNDNTQLKQELEERNEELEKLYDDVESHKSKVERLTGSEKIIKNENDQLKEKLSEAINQIKNKRDKFSELQNSIGEIRKVHNDEMAELRRSLEVESRQSSVASQEEVSSVEGKYKEILAAHEKVLNDYSAKIGELTMERNELESQLRNEIEYKQREAEGLRAKLEQSLKESAEYEAALDEEKERVRELSRDINSYKSESSNLSSELKDFNNQMILKGAQIKELTNRIADYEKQRIQDGLFSDAVNNLTEENSKLINQIKANEETFSNYREQINNMKVEVGVLQAENNEMKMKLEKSDANRKLVIEKMDENIGMLEKLVS